MTVAQLHLSFAIFVALTVLLPIGFIYIAHFSRLAAFTRTLMVFQTTVSAVVLVFGLNLAFLSNEVWGTYDKARAVVESEGDTLRNLARVVQGIKAPIGRELLIALQSYESYTVRVAWPLLAAGAWEHAEAGSLAAIAVTVNSDEMSAAAKPPVQSQLIAGVNAMRSLRNQRFSLATSGLNPIKWTLTCFLDIVTLCAITLANLDRRNQHIVASLLFFAVSTPPILLLYMQANPFAGYLPVSAQPIEIALNHVTAALAGTR